MGEILSSWYELSFNYLTIECMRPGGWATNGVVLGSTPVASLFLINMSCCINITALLSYMFVDLGY